MTKKLLLVEDNEDNADMLIRRLQRRGYDVLLAMDGQQAIERAIADSPDLILMDVNLPVLDGLEATRQIRTRPGMDQLPIIALTAHAMSGDRANALSAGCDDYHTKPIEFPQLLEQIERLLARKNMNG